MFCVCVSASYRQATKSDLEQRHTQLDDIFTLAQNIKNKTSNLDVRTSITEKCTLKRKDECKESSFCLLSTYFFFFFTFPLPSGAGAKPVGQHPARRGGPAASAGQHDRPQQPMGGEEEGGQGHVGAQRRPPPQPLAAVHQRPSDQAAR